jgi:hypothetical protein
MPRRHITKFIIKVHGDPISDLKILMLAVRPVANIAHKKIARVKNRLL